MANPRPVPRKPSDEPLTIPLSVVLTARQDGELRHLMKMARLTRSKLARKLLRLGAKVLRTSLEQRKLTPL